MDENGKVTYSTIPPNNDDQSEVLDLLAEPSESEVTKAQQRNLKIQEDLERNRQTPEREAERIAQSNAQSRRETVVVVPPNPVPLLYPYPHYHRYRYHRPGYRHRVPGHYRVRPGYRSHRTPSHLYRPRY